MKIISDQEAFQIYKRSVETRITEKFAEQSKTATDDEKNGIIRQIKAEVTKELRQFNGSQVERGSPFIH